VAQVPQIVTEVPRAVFGYLARVMIAGGQCDMVAPGRALRPLLSVEGPHRR
jgi:hypothetical protein